jgi:hypothetical protein
MKPNVTVTEDRVTETIRALQALAKKECLIGIPEATSSRPGEPITNAELGYLQETGSPANHIPARPFLVPGVVKVQAAAAVILRKGAEATLDQGQPVETALDKAGTLAENAVKRMFTAADNGWAPNAPSTVARKGSDRPLIDTGELRRSITHVVVKTGQQD